MAKQVTFNVDEDIFDKFCLALNLSGQTQDEVVESCLRWYIANTFEKASQDYNPKKKSDEPKDYYGKAAQRIPVWALKPNQYNPKKKSDEPKDYYGKAAQRIPVWALKPNQYNHKIIRAFFEAEDIAENVTLTMLEGLCSDKEHPELYVPTFRNNYSQMKIDGPKSHGKVFEDDGENVWIWQEVEEVLLKYKSSFYEGKT